MRTRTWKKVLPPEEYERRQEEDEHDTSEVVVEPEALDEPPVLRDPYIDQEQMTKAHGTLPARTGSAKRPTQRPKRSKRSLRPGHQDPKESP